jgi:hypothetical protein
MLRDHDLASVAAIPLLLHVEGVGRRQQRPPGLSLHKPRVSRKYRAQIDRSKMIFFVGCIGQPQPVQVPLCVRTRVELGHALQEWVPGASSESSARQATSFYHRGAASTDSQEEPLS